MKSLQYILVTAALVLGANQLFAQQEIRGTHNMCEGTVFPLKLDDVVGLGLSGGGGSWAEVSAADNSVVLDNQVSNVFLGVDRIPGTYEFVFTPKGNPCLGDDDRAIATIVIWSKPTPVSHMVILCAGTTLSFDLSTLLKQEVKDSYTIAYKDEAGTSLPSSTVDINAEGEYKYTYHLSASDNPCVDQEEIVLNVVAIGVADVVDFTAGLQYCAATLPETVNLNAKLGLTADDGVWVAPEGAPAITNGIVALAGAAHGIYDYTYEYKDCEGASKTKTFTIDIEEDLSTSFNNVTKDYCKTISASGTIDLMDVLGVGFPNSVGVWSEVSASSTVDVADGIFELVDSRLGSYTYRFTVSEAVDLCGVGGLSADVTLNIFDNSEILDGEVQLCASNLESGSSLDLAEYMKNIPAGGSWKKADGTVITGSTADVSSLALGVHLYNYTFNGGPCGDGEAQLIVVVTDMLTNFKDKTKSYCLTDEGADKIDLDQILGVGNVEGTWENTSHATNYNTTSHVFDGKSEGVGTYTFTFTATGEGCGVSIGDKVVITIKVTESLAS
ncbi:MAG: hypothetical protein ACK5IJ_11700 [Mangrovibacterium sp.]